MNNNFQVRSVDMMKISQDAATNPPSASHIDIVVSKAKDLGATHVAISVPYDLPNGGGDVTAQKQAWVDSGDKYGVSIWFRPSWCSDQGFYGVAKDNNNDRIQDTVNWIKSNKGLFRDGQIFTPKPEPQNCGINGVNAGSDYRFSSVAQFNQWLRDMQKACQNAFTALGINVKVGYWGFDGFIVCGYGNPDWQGKSFLEPATVQALGNVLAVDHYPELVGKPMTDFLSVFKQVWPGVNYVAGEWGAVGSNDPVTQVNTTMGALAADPIVTGINYWVLSDNGAEALLDANLAITPAYTTVQKFFAGATSTPTPTPTPQPTPTPATSDGYTGEYFDNQTLSGQPRLIRTDRDINFDWGANSPDISIPADHFSARWTKTANFVEGEYAFTMTVDDGGRLYIDEKLVLDGWKDQSATEYTTTQTLTGGSHTIRMEYYENAGGAVAKLTYKLLSPAPAPTPTPQPIAKLPIFHITGDIVSDGNTITIKPL